MPVLYAHHSLPREKETVVWIIFCDFSRRGWRATSSLEGVSLGGLLHGSQDVLVDAEADGDGEDGQ